MLNDWWFPQDEDTVRAELAEATKKADELKALVREAEAKPDDALVQASLKIRLALMNAADTPLEELARLAETPGLDPELKGELDLWLAGRRVQAVFEDAQEGAESREEFEAAVHAGLYPLLRQRLALPPDHDLAQPYYDMGLDAAVAKGDRETARFAFDGFEATLRAILESRPQLEERIQDSIDDARERLESIPDEGEAPEAPEKG